MHPYLTGNYYLLHTHIIHVLTTWHVLSVSKSYVAQWCLLFAAESTTTGLCHKAIYSLRFSKYGWLLGVVTIKLQHVATFYNYNL